MSVLMCTNDAALIWRQHDCWDCAIHSLCRGVQANDLSTAVSVCTRVMLRHKSSRPAPYEVYSSLPLRHHRQDTHKGRSHTRSHGTPRSRDRRPDARPLRLRHGVESCRRTRVRSLPVRTEIALGYIGHRFSSPLYSRFELVYTTVSYISPSFPSSRAPLTATPTVS